MKQPDFLAAARAYVSGKITTGQLNDIDLWVFGGHPSASRAEVCAEILVYHKDSRTVADLARRAIKYEILKEAALRAHFDIIPEWVDGDVSRRIEEAANRQRLARLTPD